MPFSIHLFFEVPVLQQLVWSRSNTANFEVWHHLGEFNQSKLSFIGFYHCSKGQANLQANLFSGHYRPPAANFRAFHHALQQQGVDMSHVSMSKSYIMLAGIEGYTKTKQKTRAVHEKVDASKSSIIRETEEHGGP